MRPDRRHDRGSVLFLFPAALVIVLLLGALAIDAGAVFLRQRDLAAAAGAAANDATTLGLDLERLRSQGQVVLDPAQVEAAVHRSLLRRGVLGSLAEAPRVRIVGSRVEVTLVAEAEHVMSPALPGGTDGRRVRVTVTADAVLDG